MADVYIPFEIQAEIMKRLPVKSLIRFTSVSKPWETFIHSSKFILDHQVMASQHHLLLGCIECRGNQFKNKYVSIVDNDTFSDHKIRRLPKSVNGIYFSGFVVGSSGGLLCFDSIDYPKTNAIIWNPTIKKSVTIDVPRMLQTGSYRSIVGFGVSPRSNDPMLVRITIHDRKQVQYPPIPSQVEIFKLSLGFWRSPRSNLPRKSIMFISKQVVLNEFIYWHAHDRFYVDGVHGYYHLIMSFNMISEEFTEIYLPESLTSSKIYVSIYTRKESLIVVENNPGSNVTVWIMQNCDPKLFTKLFTINTPNIPKIGVNFVFRKSGELIIMTIQAFKDNKLIVYDSNSEQVDHFWISGNVRSVTPYIETLLLLDYKDTGNIPKSRADTMLLIDHKDTGNISKSRADTRRGLDWASKVWRSMKSCIY